MFDIKIKEIEGTKFTNEGSFLQTPFWAEFKSNHGWKYKRFEVTADITEAYYETYGSGHSECKSEEKGDEVVKTFELSVLIRSFAENIFSIAYIPLAPELLFKCTDEAILEEAFDSQEVSCINETLITPDSQTIEYANFLCDLSKVLKSFLPKNTICVRFDPAIEFSNPEYRDDFNQGMKTVAYADRLKLKKNSVDIQPPDSTQIDLTKSEDEILASMKSKWRYNIRLAEKKGVSVKKISGNDSDLSTFLDIFYELYATTAERDGIAIHSKSYYEDLIKKSSDEIALGKDVPEISLYIASHEEDNLAAIITLFSKTESIYLYGCSSNVKRNLMPAYLLQWTAIKDAKTYGSQYYDMYGMPPTDDENHPMHGLYLFKTGFGGKNIHRPGSYDVPTSNFYAFYNFAEKLRAFWHKKIMKKIRGR